MKTLGLIILALITVFFSFTAEANQVPLNSFNNSVRPGQNSTQLLSSSIDFLTNALVLQEKRAEILANNIANQNTPNFKAKDIDYKEALEDIKNNMINKKNMINSRTGHESNSINIDDAFFSKYKKYRAVMQPSLDNNTVDIHIEQGKFGENAVRHSATLKLLESQIKRIQLAIRG